MAAFEERVNLPGYTILLVDDSEVDRTTYRRLLQQRTFPGSACQSDACQILEAETGQEALAYCQQRMPDVILLDYLLPDMSGLDVLQELRQQKGQEKLPVIVITGQSSTEAAVAVLKGGAADYLDKTQIGAESLHRAVTTVIQQMQLAQALQQQQQRQQLLTSTALKIRQSLTLEEILQTTAQEVRRILDCDRVALYQFHSDWSGSIAVEAVADPAFSILGQLIADGCFPEEWLEPYRQGRTRAIDNIYTANLSECHVEFLTGLQVKANVIVPILPGNRLWGLLVAHECQAPRQWQAEDIEFLGQLATQVSIAIHQAMLVEQLQWELQERQKVEQELEQRVAERTQELVASNNRLQQELFERERTKRALQTSEARFRSTFEDAAIGMALFDPNGLFLRGNPALCQFFGYSQAELRELTFQTITHPEDLATDLSYVHQVLANEIQSYQLEKRYFHKNGQIIWGLLSVSLVRDPLGEPLYFISQIQDISDRKQTEIALEQELLRSKALYQASFDGIVTLDRQGYVVEASQSFARMLGHPLEKVLTLHVSDWDAKWTKSELIEIVGNSTLIDSKFETIHRRKDGSLYDVEISATEVQLQDETIQLCICRDISARKQSEAILQEANRRWRSLLDNVQLIVVGLDQQGNVEYANPFFLELTHFTSEEVLGKNWMEHFTPGYQRSNLQQCFQEVIEYNFHPHYQNPILTKSGEQRMIAWSNTLLRDTEGSAIGTISIGEDITERHKLEQMKAEFISVVSHELRTPLTSIQAALSLLVENIIDPTSAEGQDVIQIAATGVDRLVRLVNDILDLERLESGKVRLEKQLCNTFDLISTAIGQMQEMANQSGVCLSSTPQSFQIYADPDRLLQVLINLLSNAIKFSPLGSTVTLDIQETENQGQFPSSSFISPMLLFTVRDQGRGIPTDNLESIFERFHQVDASDSRDKGGTGLGLAICRNIVQQHGGQIWAESDLGQGSTFYFTLPLEDHDHDHDN